MVATSSAIQELGWKEGDTFFVKRTEMVEREQEQTREQRTGDVESRWASVSEIMGFTSLLWFSLSSGGMQSERSKEATSFEEQVESGAQRRWSSIEGMSSWEDLWVLLVRTIY